MEDNIKKLIEDYHDGLLGEEDKTKLLEMAESNIEIMKELTIQKHIMNTGEYIGRRELRLELDKIHEELYPNEIRTSKNKTKYWPLYLLLAIASLVAAFFFQQRNVDNSNESLIAIYYTPMELNLGKRNANTQQFKELTLLYNANKYDKLIAEVNSKNVSINELPSPILLALAVSNIETKQYNEALLLLNNLESREDFNIQDEIDWYRSMTYLHMNNISELKSSLKKIIELENHDYRRQAIALFNQI